MANAHARLPLVRNEPVITDRSRRDLSEVQLLAAARHGDKAAFEHLWMCNVAAARAFARRHLPPESVEDVVADAFCSIWQAMGRGRGPTDDFRAYLLTSIRARGATWLIRRSREHPVDDRFFAEEAAPEEVPLFSDDQQSDISAAYYALRPRDRLALEWSEIQGLPPTEVASRLGVTVTAAYQVIFRAKSRLREKYVEVSGNQQLLPPESTVGVAPAGGGSTRLGRVLVAGIVGAGVSEVGLTAGKAQAATWSGLAEPTGMPVLPVAPPAIGAWGLVGRGMGVVAAVAVLLASSAMPPLMQARAVGSPTAHVAVTAPLPTFSLTAISTPSVTPSPPPPSSTPTPTASPSAAPSSTAPVAPVVVPTPAAVAALTITRVDAGPSNVCYPTLTGRALPGTRVVVSSLNGANATVTAGADGTWQTGRLTGMESGTADVTASDAAGVQPSAAVAVTLARAPSLGVSSTSAGLSVVAAGGIPGLSAAFLVDGASVGTVTLDASGAAAADFALTLASGPHAAALRYQTSTCQGPAVTLSVTVA